jgi:predicted aldo/keto reductase-like oxidoreductase
MTTITRRGFFKTTTAAAAGAALPAGQAAPGGQQSPAPKVKHFNTLGRTGWKVSDVSAGSGQNDPAVLDYIFQAGINLVDTGQQYTGHEEVIGKILPKWRSKVFILDKWDPPLVTPTVTKSALLESLDVSLKKLNTTYIDCMMLHAIGHPRYGGLDRIQNPAIYEAYDEAKKLGKIRFTGASSHGPRVVEDMSWGIDNNRFDVILVGANFLTHGLEPVLKKARAKGIGTIAMKTMTLYTSDLNIRALQGQHTNARQACLKWVLASGLFDTLVVRMPNFQAAAEYLAVSGTTKLTTQDRGRLDLVAEHIGRDYCRPGCDACLDACPGAVPIADVLRYRMYFESYREQKLGLEKYARVPAARRADRCQGCPAPCEAMCPYGVRIRERMTGAHRMLSFV